MEVICILPDDLVQGILSRLPVRDLLRFRCVSKDWQTLIDSPSFIRNHYQVQYSICKVDGNMPHFVYDFGVTCHGEFYLMSIHQGDVSTVDLNKDLLRDCFSMLPFGIEGRDQCRVTTYGCVNGVALLCFTLWREKCMGLWNPSTREFKSIAYPYAPHLVNFSISGFGFDMKSNDFKILATCIIISGIEEDNIYYEVCSIKTNAWKRLRAPAVIGLPCSGTDGYFNGVYYWYGFRNNENESNLAIVSFNFTSEIYTVSDFPEDAKSWTPGTSRIMVTLYKESIGLFMSYEVQEKSLLFNIDIWVVKGFDDCGVPLSWQHLFTVGPTPTKLRLEVAATQIDGNLLVNFLYQRPNIYVPDDTDLVDEYYHYNSSTAEFTYMNVGLTLEYYRYVESLFPLSKRFES